MTARQVHVDLSAVLSIRTIAILECLYMVIIIRRCAQVGQNLMIMVIKNFSGYIVEKLGGEPLFSEISNFDIVSDTFSQ